MNKIKFIALVSLSLLVSCQTPSTNINSGKDGSKLFSVKSTYGY